MLNSKDRKIISVILMLLMVFTSLGATMAAEGSDVTTSCPDPDKITKNVTNVNGSDDTINYGDILNFTITARNDHDDDERFRVNDTLPTGLEFINYTATQGTYNSTSGIWDIGELEGDNHPSIHETATLYIFAKVIDSCTTITNTAKLEIRDRYWDWAHWCWVYYWDYEAKANTTFFVPCAADLGITKVVNNTSPKLNDNINFTINATNNGPDNATGVTVNDLLPAGLQYVSDNSGGAYNSTTGIWTIGNLANGASALLNIIAKVVLSNVNITNTANVTGCEFDPCLANNTANVCINVPKATDLGITKVVNNTNPKLNDTINFTINATNNGPDNATGVTVNDLLPAGLQYVSDNSGGAYNSTTGIWTIGNLANGASALLNIIAKAVLSNVNITNTANVTGCEFDPCLANNTASTTISVPAQSNLYLNITAPTTCVGLNSIQQIIFKVGNYGPDTADYTNVTWVIPEGMEFVNATVDVGTFFYDAATRTITWNIGNVPVGDPYMWLFVKVLKEGNFLVNPTLSTTTYDPTLSTNVQFKNICVQAAGGEETVAAATVGMQNTGAPIGMLVLALLAVLGGLIVPKRKK